MDRHIKALEILKAGTVIPATPLALNKDKSISVPGMKLLMQYYLNCGVGGIATAVHTTQFEIRDPEFNLYEQVLTLVSSEIDKYEAKTGKVIVKVAGVCGKTEQAVSEAKLAKSLGFDAVLLSPGGLNDMSEDYMVERTKAVAEVMPVIGFYLQTAVGGRVFSYDYWARVCEVSNVVAIKCASFNRYTTEDVVRAAALSTRCDDITLYTGNDDNIVIDLLTRYSFLKDGVAVEKDFKGGLLGHWSVWTKKAVEIYEKAMAAKYNECVPASLLTLAAEVTDTNSAFFDTAHSFKGSIAGLHEILHRQGLMENTLCLSERECLSEGQLEQLDRVQAAYPHLNDDDFIKANIAEWKKNIV